MVRWAILPTRFFAMQINYLAFILNTQLPTYRSFFFFCLHLFFFKNPLHKISDLLRKNQ